MSRRGQEDSRYHRAKKEGYAARSVYKLQEIDNRYKVLRTGQRILDLGSHPGSWSQYALSKIGTNGLLVGVDLQPPTVSLGRNAHFWHADLLETSADDLRFFTTNYHVVLSDVAPRTTGIAHADQAASQALAQQALDLALQLLLPGGALVVKVFFGPHTPELIKQVKQNFTLGKAHKPDASQSASREIYILGTGFKGLIIKPDPL